MYNTCVNKHVTRVYACVSILIYTQRSINTKNRIPGINWSCLLNNFFNQKHCLINQLCPKSNKLFLKIVGNAI